MYRTKNGEERTNLMLNNWTISLCMQKLVFQTFIRNSPEKPVITDPMGGKKVGNRIFEFDKFNCKK